MVKKIVKKPLRMRGDNQSVSLKNLETGKIERVKRWYAEELVAALKWAFVPNSEWRKQKKEGS